MTELTPEARIALEREFAVALEDVFGERSEEFSDELREFLQHMWIKGMRAGVYRRDTKTPVPEMIVWSSMDERTPAQRKMQEAERKKAQIIELAEEISVRLESAVNPEVLERLEGDALTKGMHNFVTRTDRIKQRLRQVLSEVEKFRVFEP